MEKNKNALSVATFKRQFQCDSGVLKFDKNQAIFDFAEKPILYRNISMGIYAVNKKLLEPLPKNEFLGFDQLIIESIKKKFKLH